MGIKLFNLFQLILNPIRDWNAGGVPEPPIQLMFQLILNPIRDWNIEAFNPPIWNKRVPINLKPY